MTPGTANGAEAREEPALAADAPALVVAQVTGGLPPADTGGSTSIGDFGDAATDHVLETYQLHPAAQRVWAWTLGLVILAMLVPASIAATVAAGLWALLATLLAGALAWRMGRRHLRLAVERFRCERFARGLRYRHGVWWQSETFIPSARVQHTEVNQGPIARRFGLGTLKVFTAAVQLGALEIDGLAYADALLLRDRLLSRDIKPLGVASGDEPNLEHNAAQDAATDLEQNVVQDAAMDIEQNVVQDAATDLEQNVVQDAAADRA